MLRKIITFTFGFALLAGILLGTPLIARAGGVCGGTYIVDPGDTFASIASKCGTTVTAIRDANPGVNEPLTTGKSLTVPGVNFVTPVTVTVTSATIMVTPTFTPTVTPTATKTAIPTLQVSFPPNYYNYYNYYPPTNYSGIYIVQPGDTFASIASRFGVGLYDLWAANPQIWDINLIYVGQAIYVPSSSWVVTTPSAKPSSLSWGEAPAGVRDGKVILSNKAKADVYVSLQGTTRDGTTVINEYSVSGTMSVNVPAGWYVYVAWVGGEKFSGTFNLGGETEHSLTFYKNKVVVE